MVHCKGTTATCQPCRAHVRPGSDFCPFHDPAINNLVRAGRRKGGKQRSTPPATAPVPDFNLRTLEGLDDALTWALDRVLRSRETPTKIAHACVPLINSKFNVRNQGEINDRLERLERAFEAETAQRRNGQRGAKGAFLASRFTENEDVREREAGEELEGKDQLKVAQREHD